MNGALLKPVVAALPQDVRSFADAKGLNPYLDAVIDVAWQAFPSSALHVTLARDAEEETHQYIAIDVDVGSRSTEELLAGQRIWSGGVTRVCPARLAVYFVLGWR